MKFKNTSSLLSNRVASNHKSKFSTVLFYLNELSNIHNNLKVIHITGTNGKTSCAHLLGNVLHNAGFKVGVYISPHIFSPIERISVNGKCITEKKLLTIISEILDLEKTFCAPSLSFFELLTLSALYFFAQSKVEYVIVEAGIGGKYDITNILNSQISIITSISLDHTNILGKTKVAIARDKAEIIKPNSTVYCSNMPNKLKNIFVKKACLVNSKINFIDNHPFKFHSYNFDKNVSMLKKCNRLWKVNLMSIAQIKNINLVYQIAKDLKIKDKVIKHAFNTINIMSRFQMIRRDSKRYVFDGGHNIEATDNLIKTLKAYKLNNAKTIILFASSKNKKYKDIISKISKLKTDILLLNLQTDYFISPNILAGILRNIGCKNTVGVTKLNSVGKKIKKYDNIVIFGSFRLMDIMCKQLNIRVDKKGTLI